MGPRPSGWRRVSIGPRLVARIGLLLAAAGVLPFFLADFRWEEVGLGMMCTGIGMLHLAASPGRLRSRAASARRSGMSALGVVIGGGLLLAGLFLLADAVARG
jgi:hypothetical protein